MKIIYCLLICLPAFAVFGRDPGISKEKAIAIAQKKGYYKTEKSWREPEVKFDTIGHTWMIRSYKSETSHRGKCAKTNGCTIVTERIIHIDSETGKISGKERSTKKYPNYE